MMKTHCFNLIEIILAIAIITIGVSSVLGLFAAGLKTGNATIMSGNLPDATESLLNYVRSRVDCCRGNNGWTSELAKIYATGNDEPDFSSYLGENTGAEPIVKVDSNGNGFYLFRQLSVSKVDPSGKPTHYVPSFSAIAKVEKINISQMKVILTNPFTGAEYPNDESTALVDADAAQGENLLNKFRLALKVTISYPANLPKEQREEKVYVLEFFNDKYDRFSVEGEADET